jgi:hypothetical protein
MIFLVLQAAVRTGRTRRDHPSVSWDWSATYELLYERWYWLRAGLCTTFLSFDLSMSPWGPAHAAHLQHRIERREVKSSSSLVAPTSLLRAREHGVEDHVEKKRSAVGHVTSSWDETAINELERRREYGEASPHHQLCINQSKCNKYQRKW